jgi:transcriptional regulator with XRE-family HTH domain
MKPVTNQTQKYETAKLLKVGQKPTVRGRPKGKSNDKKSYGPLGDLLRKSRLDKGLGLADVAQACECSVQFISNIEHGRAPMPWEKLPQVSKFLQVSLDDLQAANLAVRSDFQHFTKTSKSKTALAAQSLSITSKDKDLQELLAAYQGAPLANRKKFIKSALKLLTEN